MNNQRPSYFVLVNPSPVATQHENINACLSLTQILRSCLGPRSFVKMIITKLNTIQTTNDCNSILRELDVSHPCLKILFDLARTQADIGDGTTTVVLLTAEILKNLKELLNIHANFLIRALRKSLRLINDKLEKCGTDATDVLKLVRECVDTKLCTMLGVSIPEMAINSIEIAKELKNIRVEKILGETSACEVFKGVLINKNIVHPQMKRRIENGKIIFVDGLEYKKGESQIAFEFASDNDFNKALSIEEAAVLEMVNEIVRTNANLVIAEKGVSDYALSLLQSHGITCLRRFKKTEIDRIKKLTNSINEVGQFTLFEYLNINGEFYCRIENSSTVATVVLRAPSKEILDELERNFDDAVKTARNLTQSKKIVPGGGAIEMILAKDLTSKTTEDETENKVFNAVSQALKIIPTLLLENSGVDALEMMPVLESFHSKEDFYGVDGKSGQVVDMRNVCMDLVSVKRQAYRSAIETVCLLLRIDGIVETK